MTAGLPGVGIGGIFYLASAIMMPVRSLVATVTGRAHEARWRVALQQAGIAAGILAVLWATGLVLGWIITTAFPHALGTNAAGVTPAHARNVVRTSALLLSFGTLAVVLLLVQVLRVTLPVRPTEQGDGAPARRAARTAA
jgi:hypothetical protein